MKEEGIGRYKLFVSVFVIVGMVMAGVVPLNTLAAGSLPDYDIEQDSLGNYHKAFIDNITGNYEIYYTNDIGGNYSQDWNTPIRITNTTSQSMLLDLGIYLDTDTMFIIWQETDRYYSDIVMGYPTYYTISQDYGANWKEPRRSYEDIMLKYANFDPLFEEPVLPPVPQDYATYGGYYIVQMKTPMIPEWREGIEGAGGTIQGYIPNNANIVQMTPSEKDVVENLPFIRWIGIYHPMYKFSEELRDIIDGGGSHIILDIDVVVFGNIYAVRDQITALGGIVESISDPYLKVKIDDTKLYDVGEITDVEWIQGTIIFTTFNDIAVGNGLMNVGATWNNPTYGLTGTGQIVAVADTGLDTGVNDASMHDDIEGRIVDIHSWPIAPWWNAAVNNPGADDGAADLGSGHGTHVTGSVLGDGTQSAGTIQGVANNAQLVFQALEQDTDWVNPNIPDGFALTGIPTDLADLFQQAYDDGARIHTNSWGAASNGQYFGPTGRQYEFHSQDVDQFVWDNRDMVILFAAGNSGTDADDDGVVDDQSVSIPATAKNCITVGASENNRPAMVNLDNDWDTRIDEDPDGDANGDGWPGAPLVSEDGDLEFDLNDVDTMIITPAQFQANPDGTSYLAWDDGINNDPFQDGDTDEADERYWAYYDQNEDGIVTTAEIINVRGPDGVGGTGDDGPNDLNGIDDDLDGVGQVNQHVPPEWTVVMGDGIDYNDPEIFDIIMDSYDFWSDGAMDNTIIGYNPAEDDDEDGWISEDPPDTYGGWWPNDFQTPPLSTDPMADNPQGMVAFSSRGNTADGRTKPDVVAPGTWILSTRSSQTAAEGWGRPELGGYDPTLNAFYTFMGGTSMATPLTAGTAALVRQYYEELHDINPSAALVKGTLINGATDIAGQYGESGPIPNINEGWGRVDCTNSILPTEPRILRFFDEDPDRQFDSILDGPFQVSITDCDPSEVLRVTLVWTDPAADPAAGGILVNDLDLTVTDQSTGTDLPIYYGNDFAGGFSTAHDPAPPTPPLDTVNNVECVYIPNPSSDYIIEVGATTIDTPGQTYALVISYGQAFETIGLWHGWNLISLPLQPDRPYITEVLRDIEDDWDIVQYFDASDTGDPWKYHYVGKPIGNDLFYLYQHMGFWIHIETAGYVDMRVYGAHFSEVQEVELFMSTGGGPGGSGTGWNMVGYPSDTNRLRFEGLNNLDFGIHIDKIQWFDGEYKTWHDLEAPDYFIKGRGYWFHMILLPIPPVWEVPVN